MVVSAETPTALAGLPCQRGVTPLDSPLPTRPACRQWGLRPPSERLSAVLAPLGLQPSAVMHYHASHHCCHAAKSMRCSNTSALNCIVENPKGQERREVVLMGAAAPTDGKRVLSAAGSPEGSRPSGKVSPQGRWEFPEKLPYLVLQITTAMQPRPQAPTVKKGARRARERSNATWRA